MLKHWTWHAALALAIGPALMSLGVKAQEPQANRSGQVTLDQLKPQWQLGEQWTVETTTRPIQVRSKAEMERGRPILWQFAVQKYEKVVADDCYRIEVHCLLEGPPQPSAVLWVDKKSQTIRQISTQIPVPGGFTTLTENYDFPNGQASPVLGPLNALPLDLPLFRGGEAKGLEKFSYDANMGPAGTKAIGDVGFSFDVEQEVAVAQPEQIKGLLADDFTKDLATKPAVEVKLKRCDRQVRQLWKAGLPWPAYSDDGRTSCRLIKVTSPAGNP